MYKYRLYPTKAQSGFLESQLREACSLYNAALEERIGAWKVCRKSIGYYDQSSQVKTMRADGCLTLANAQVCQNVLARLDRTFKAFFSRLRKGIKAGFPRFKSSRRYDSITFPQYPSGCRILPSGKLYVQGAGHVRIKLHRPVEGRVKTATIKREAGRWFVFFSVDLDTVPLPLSDKEIGIDVGIASFAVLSNGVEIQNPRFQQKAGARLRRAQRKVARRPNKRSNRRRKAVQLLQRAHTLVANQRCDSQHKLSRKLIDEYGTIAVEDLNVKGLASGILAKSIHDAGWASFIQMLSYKAECAGRDLIKVDPRGSSQTCLCGERVPKTLKDRWHECRVCGLSAGRDVVSAQVILQRAGNRPSGRNVDAVMSCMPREAVNLS